MVEARYMYKSVIRQTLDQSSNFLLDTNHRNHKPHLLHWLSGKINFQEKTM